MSRILSELLGVNEQLLAVGIKRLENIAGNPSVDVRLSAEIITRVRQKTRELGLDPRDTTSEELYQALLNLVRLHDTFLVKKIGGTDPADVDDLFPRITATVQNLPIAQNAWVLKHGAVKKLLKALPPKKVMKALGYKSLDSMLKRETVPELLAAATFMESEDWLRTYHGKYSTLKPSDFETRKIDIIQLKSKKWGKGAEHIVNRERHNIIFLKDVGAIVMLPLPVKSLPGITITALPILLHYIGEIRMHSAYFKLNQMQPDFGERLVAGMASEANAHISVSGQTMHWRTVQRHFGQAKRADHPELFEPHVQPDDLRWQKIEEVLYRIEPAIHFWHQMDFVAATTDEGPVSFNLMDMALNYINHLDYDSRTSIYFRSSLWNEFCQRYIAQPAHEADALRQLNGIVAQELMLIEIGDLN